jgi:Fic family protein
MHPELGRLEKIPISHEILGLIAEVDEFKGRWEALRTLSPERLSRLRHVATIESIGSSTRIEGARLSDREVEALLANLHRQSFRSRDEEEVAGYAACMDLVFQSWEEITLTENHIRQLHRELLRHSDRDEPHRGNYKIVSNHVVAFGPDGKELGVVFETVTPLPPRSKCNLW